MAKRGNPKWKKGGQSPNPAGRGKDTLGAFLRDKSHLPQEIFDAVYPLLKSHDERIRLQAAEFLTDRRDGKPMQSVSVDGKLDVGIDSIREKVESFVGGLFK